MVPGINGFYLIKIFTIRFNNTIMSPFADKISLLCFQVVFIMKTVFGNCFFIKFETGGPKLVIEVLHSESPARVIVSKLFCISAYP